jgi:hypothetical protein
MSLSRLSLDACRTQFGDKDLLLHVLVTQSHTHKVHKVSQAFTTCLRAIWVSEFARQSQRGPFTAAIAFFDGRLIFQ